MTSRHDWERFELETEFADWALEENRKDNISNFEAESLKRLAEDIWGISIGLLYVIDGVVYNDIDDNKIYLAKNCVPILKEMGDNDIYCYYRID